MAIRSTHNNGVLILFPEGRVDSFEAAEFQNDVQSAIGDSDKAVVMDLEQLTYISSAGLRTILESIRHVEQRGGKLAICSLSGSVQDVFRISGFDRVVSIYPSQEEAVQSVSG